MSNELTTKAWLQSPKLQTQIQQALPDQQEISRFMRALFTQVQKTPKLMYCTQASLFSCVIQCAELGILPDGRRAHLIPYGKDATVIVDYKGLVELALGSGKVSYIHADVVCENDEFETDLGRVSKHKIDWKQERGEPFAAYAVAKLESGDYLCEVMQRAEIETIRKNSKAGKSGPWVDHWPEMAKKTAVRRLCKWLPLTPKIRKIVDLDDEQFATRQERNVTEAPPLPELDNDEESKKEGATA